MAIVLGLVILIISAILHEVMHGVVADKLGDPTARLAGRLTLNPVPHIDPVMSILVPILMLVGSGGAFAFGSAKPVPVNPIHFRDPLKDMALTALAGPLTNVTIAIVAGLIFKIAYPNLNVIDLINNSAYFLVNNFSQSIIPILLSFIVLYNLMLAILNLVPIPPLDGSRVVAALLPRHLAFQYLSIERYGIFILLALLFFPIGGFSLGNLISSLIMFSIHLLGI